MKIFLIFCLALGLTVALRCEGADDQKRIIVDFEDVGTWRMVDAKGVRPEAWWAGGACLGGSDKEKDHDRYVGELKFAFDPASPGPWSAAFQRQKMTLVAGTLNGIEFDADSKGLPVNLRFVLGDSKGQRFTAGPVALSGGWRSYRLNLDEGTVPGFQKCTFPAHLEQIVLEAAKPCEGSIFLDDIALTGQFADRDQLSVFPVADSVAIAPDKPFKLLYRLCNARSTPLPVTTRIDVRDFDGHIVFQGRRQDLLPSYGQTVVDFSLPGLAVGAYASAVTVDAGSFQVSYDDPLGVFVPNGHRLNHSPMWFGVDDLTSWHSEGETRLHLEWMRMLGVDLDRVWASCNRLEPKKGVFGFDAWKRVLGEVGGAGIDVSLVYLNTPGWTQSPPHDPLRAPDDLDAYSEHISAVASFLKTLPQVKYVEFWNEPDAGPVPGGGSFHGTLDDYLRMFASFSKAMHAGDPGIRIANGGLCVIHPKERKGFAQGVIQQGAGDYDVAAFHAHGPLVNYVDREEVVEGWMNAAGIDKPIVNTETGERSNYDPAGRAAQAATLVKKITYAKSRPKTGFYTWFTLKDFWDMDRTADDSFGLVTSDNRVKPSFVAYNALIRELADTSPLGPAELGGAIESYAFRRPDNSMVYVCWPKPGHEGSVSWLYTTSQLVRTDLFGRGQSLSILENLTPVYLGFVPFYLETPVGTSPLKPVPRESYPLEWTRPILTGHNAALSLSLTMRNPTASLLKGEVSVDSEDGQKVWKNAVSLAPSAETSLDVALPSKSGSQRYRINFHTASGSDFSFPLEPIDAYPISPAPGNPMAPAQASFIQGLPAIRLDRQQDVFELSFDPAIPRWSGPGDLSVTARSCHDKEGIYFRFDVTDGKYVPPDKPNELWRGDSVQLAIATPEQRKYTIVNLGQTMAGSIAWCDSSPNPDWEGQWNVPLRIVRHGALTTYEVFIPFLQLGISEPVDRSLIRFSFLVNENDGQGRVRWMHWHDGIARGGFDSLGYGYLQ